MGAGGGADVGGTIFSLSSFSSYETESDMIVMLLLLVVVLVLVLVLVVVVLSIRMTPQLGHGRK